MQLVRKAMETSKTEEITSSEDSGSDEEGEDEDKENEMQVDNNQRGGK